MSDKNVFDLMVPSAQRGSSEDEVLHANRPFVTNLVDALAAHVEEGELFGLVAKFEDKHLAHKLQSWIGRGANLPITATEVKEVLGEDFLNDLMRRLAAAQSGWGNDPKELPKKISEVLPSIIRRFARTGQIPPKRILLKSVADFHEKLEP